MPHREREANQPEQRRPTTEELKQWIRQRVSVVPKPPTISEVPSNEVPSSHETVYIPQGGYGLTSADSTIAFAPGTYGQSPCVAIGLFDPATGVAALAHFNVFSSIDSLDTMLGDMFEDSDPSERESLYARVQATVVGGNESSPRSVDLTAALLFRLDQRRINLQFADVLTDPYEQGRPIDINERAFIVDTRHNGRAIARYIPRERIIPIPKLKFQFPYFSHPLTKVFEGRPGKTLTS